MKGLEELELIDTEEPVEIASPRNRILSTCMIIGLLLTATCEGVLTLDKASLNIPAVDSVPTMPSAPAAPEFANT